MIMLSNFLFDELHYVRLKLNIWVTELVALTESCKLFVQDQTKEEGYGYGHMVNV